MTQKIRTLTLIHPLLDVPATATILRNYFVDGRYTGYVLQFPDGHTVALTFSELIDLDACAFDVQSTIEA